MTIIFRRLFTHYGLLKLKNQTIFDFQKFSKMNSTSNLDYSHMFKLLKDITISVSAVSTESKAHQFCRYYLDLPPEGKQTILKHIAQKYHVDHSVVKQAAHSFIVSQEQGEAQKFKAEEKLRISLTPPYSQLFNKIGRLGGGVKFLVDFRTDLLNILPVIDVADPAIYHLRALNSELRELLSLWFSVGFLTLERITWNSSCDMLQKISEYEAVHPMRSWTDLKRRVGAYRRCYVFTHSSMPAEPIVVLHTALTSDISSSIQSIVINQRMHSEGDITRTMMPTYQVEDPKRIHAAIFYSVTSTQKGLHGIELGNQLIKRVVKEVHAEYPHIKQFSTLSPIPGFSEWFIAELKKLEKDESSSLFTPEEISILKEYVCSGEYASSTLWMRLSKILSRTNWIQDAKLVEMLQHTLMRICTHYLCKEKRRGYVLNSVAHFHLRNGAVLWRLNWQADLSPRGLANSFGMMVNYRYFPEAAEENSRKYTEEFHVEVSEQISHLMQQNHHQSAL